MSCDTYKDALNSVAAGAPATSALRSHLVSCAACRAALAAEQALLGSIDAGLRLVANAEIPPSLVPSARVRLQESTPQARWIVPSLVPAAAVLLVALFVAHEFRWFILKPSDRNSAASVSPPTQPEHSQSPSFTARRTPPQTTRLAAAVLSRGSSSPLASRSESQAETVPEILVPRDQQALLADYAEQWRNHRRVVLTAEQSSDAPLKPLEVAPIQIALLDVKPLADEVSR